MPLSGVMFVVELVSWRKAGGPLPKDPVSVPSWFGSLSAATGLPDESI